MLMVSAAAVAVVVMGSERSVAVLRIAAAQPLIQLIPILRLVRTATRR